MKRRTAFVGVAGTSSLLVIAALVSPVVTNAATPASQTSTSAHVVITRPGATAPTAATSTPRRLTSTQARAIVRKQARGGHVTDVRGLRHGGYDAFAVRITRTDGSSLTGYIDRDSGVVFDWKQTAAPVVSKAAALSSASIDDDADSADDNSDDQQGDSDDADFADVNDQQGDNDDQGGEYDDQGDTNDDQGDQQED